MKRKKPPIALISVMVVSMLGLVIAGKAFSFYNLSGEEQAKQLQQEAEDRARAAARAPENNEKIDSSRAMSDIKSKLQSPPDKPSVAKQAGRVATDDQPGGKNFKTAVPTVIMPEESVYIPKPNSAAPTAQWYDKN
jgi:type II secretory pathway pseudopilin PulG